MVNEHSQATEHGQRRMPEVTVCLPTLGRDASRLRRCVDSVKAQSDCAKLDIVLVDNSLNGIERIDGVSHHRFFGINLGYVGSIEIVRRSTKAPYLWAVQDDMVAFDGTLRHLLKRMASEPDLGAISPIIDDGGGATMISRRAGFRRSTSRGGRPWEIWPKRPISVDEVDPSQNFDFVFSSGTLYRMAALNEIGGFRTEMYPLTHVDIDIGYRLNESGWRSRVCPEAVMHHKKGGSTRQTLLRVSSRLNTPLLDEMTVKTRAKEEIDLNEWRPMVERMSHLFYLLAEDYEQQLKSVRADSTAEIKLMQESWSWRITRPLRWCWNILSRFTPSGVE